MNKKLKKFFNRLFNLIKKPEMRILPGQLAFFLMLSIIPLVAVIASIIANFSLSIDAIIELINDSFPKEVAEIVVQAIGGKNLNFNIVAFYVSAFILASNGPHSMIIGANLIYKVEGEGFIARRIKALIMTITLVMLLVFMLAVPAYGDIILALIDEIISSNALMHTITFTYNLLKYPVSFILIFFCIKVLYTLAPDKRIKSKTTTYGAVFTTVSWIIATEVYSFYVSAFAKYNLLYGSIANLIILLLWVYLLSYIFVLGMVINVSREERKEEKVKELEEI